MTPLTSAAAAALALVALVAGCAADPSGAPPTTPSATQAGEPSPTPPGASPTGAVSTLEPAGFTVEDLSEHAGEMVESLAHSDIAVSEANRWVVTPDGDPATVVVERIVFDPGHPRPSDDRILAGFGSTGDGVISDVDIAGEGMARFDDHNGNAALLWTTESFAVRFQATEGRGHDGVERVAEAVVEELRDDP